MKEIDHTVGIYWKITMKEIGPIAGIDCKNTMTEKKLYRRDRLPKYYKNDYEREYYNTFQDHGNRRKYKDHYKDKYEREYYNTFQDHGNRRNYKDHYKDKYRDENFYDSDRSDETDNSHGRDRAYDRNRSYSRDRDNSQEYKGDRLYIRDRSYDRNDSYSRDRLQGYYRECKDQRYERRSKDYYKDRYSKDNHRSSGKNKHRYQNKDQYKNYSYGKSSRSKERDYLYDEDDIFHSKIERVHEIQQTMSPEKGMAIGFILTFSENPDKI